jgi:hypothetical protein
MLLKKKRQYKEQPDEFLTMVCYYKDNLQSLYIIIRLHSKIYFYLLSINFFTRENHMEEKGCYHKLELPKSQCYDTKH